eukprot:284818840_4
MRVVERSGRSRRLCRLTNSHLAFTLDNGEIILEFLDLRIYSSQLQQTFASSSFSDSASSLTCFFASSTSSTCLKNQNHTCDCLLKTTTLNIIACGDVYELLIRTPKGLRSCRGFRLQFVSKIPCCVSQSLYLLHGFLDLLEISTQCLQLLSGCRGKLSSDSRLFSDKGGIFARRICRWAARCSGWHLWSGGLLAFVGRRAWIIVFFRHGPPRGGYSLVLRGRNWRVACCFLTRRRARRNGAGCWSGRRRCDRCQLRLKRGARWSIWRRLIFRFIGS